MKDYAKLGINIFATKGTFEAVNFDNTHRANPIEKLNTFNVGNFKVMAFSVKHDAADPVGFLIEHPDCGKVLFLTDTHYCPYLFKGLNQIIIEANYYEAAIVDKSDFLRNRILKSHMSLETCIKTLQANDLSAVNNIVLIHLSDTNSNEVFFKNETERQIGHPVHVANNGDVINFNKMAI